MKFINNKKNLCILDKIEILFSQLTKYTTQYAEQLNMEMQQFIQSIIFNDFKERINAKICKRFNIYISDKEFKNIENITIEESKSNRKYFTAQPAAKAAPSAAAKAYISAQEAAAHKAIKMAHKYALFKHSKKQRPKLNVF